VRTELETLSRLRLTNYWVRAVERFFLWVPGVALISCTSIACIIRFRGGNPMTEYERFLEHDFSTLGEPEMPISVQIQALHAPAGIALGLALGAGVWLFVGVLVALLRSLF